MTAKGLAAASTFMRLVALDYGSVQMDAGTAGQASGWPRIRRQLQSHPAGTGTSLCPSMRHAPWPSMRRTGRFNRTGYGPRRSHWFHPHARLRVPAGSICMEGSGPSGKFGSQEAHRVGAGNAREMELMALPLQQDRHPAAQDEEPDGEAELGDQLTEEELLSLELRVKSAAAAEQEAVVQEAAAAQEAVLEEERDRKEGGEGEGVSLGGVAAGGGIILGVLGVGLIFLMATMGHLYKDQISDFLVQFEGALAELGPSGYLLFVFVYAGLEVLAIPAIPLTMSAGLLFGQVTGTCIVSAAGTLAATIAFLIARYLVRDRVRELAAKNTKFIAIDKAIGKNSFKVVTLLRLSPLMPFSLGNYLYGLTSVRLAPYVVGSWLGMLPGTFAYVSAGSAGKLLLASEKVSSGGPELWSLAVGLVATIGATLYVGHLAKNAMQDIE